MQDSNTATTTRTGGGARRELVMDRTTTTTTTWVSCNARATHSSSFPFCPSSFRSHVTSCVAAKVLASGDSRQPVFLLFRHRMSACVLPSRPHPSSDLPACTSNSYATRPGKRASFSSTDDEEEEAEAEADIVVEVDDEGEEINPWSSEEPSSYRSLAISSLGQPIPSRYQFTFRHPAREGSMSSAGSPPFAFSRATATPQSKSTSTRESHETRSTGNVETAIAFSSLIAFWWLPHFGCLPPRPCRALRMYAACPCPHTIQLPEVVVNAPRQRQVLSPTSTGGLTATRSRHVRGASAVASEHWLGSLTGV
jgi:hypothetical protein